MAERFWMETLGCPKNQVDSDKLAGTLTRDGFEEAATPEDADLVVVNTCAFIEAARQESIDTILELSDARREGARLVVTGCMAERYGEELAASLPEVDLVAPFGVALRSPDTPHTPHTPRTPHTPHTPHTPVSLTSKPGRATPDRPAPPSGLRPGTGVAPLPSFDLLNLPRPPASAPWAYIKVAEGCDRNCGFCAIPSFRGKQRSRSTRSILDEADQLGAAAGNLKEVVLVAQDLSSFALDRSTGRPTARGRPTADGNRPIVDLVAAMSERVAWTRLLYLYPSTLDDALVEAIVGTGVPYFDLSLQHVSRPLLKRMRRWGEGERFLQRIASIRRAEPGSAFRSSFIIGYPGETEADHDQLLAWIEEAQLDWVGFFPFSIEVGTYAADLDDQIPDQLVAERLRECTALQDAITAHRRDNLIGTRVEVLVDAPGEGRTYREAPEIDGIVVLPEYLPVGSFVDAIVTGADGPDLVAEPASDGHRFEPASKSNQHRAGALR
ncbi:MAG: 30S ribosomal protein S12 methylthiotransferase RimO [Acidimicrobiales bacterium]